MSTLRYIDEIFTGDEISLSVKIDRHRIRELRLQVTLQSIAESKNTSLAVVAPGIAVALFATALGLAAAIPAVVAYNKFSADLDKIGSALDVFAQEFSTLLGRQLDEGNK